jgi:ADP-ribose pyrophosphatase YjhB (NUDIX family)
MPKKNSHCSYCGAAFAESQPWPRKCANCGEMTFLNPIPVVVVIVPVDDGVLLIRRNVEPRSGLLALPGGYVDLGETWQAAGAREVYEETGLRVDAAALSAFQVHSGDYNTLLIFATAEPLTASDLPPFTNTDETTERIVVREAQELAFPLHGQVMRQYFEQRPHSTS